MATFNFSGSGITFSRSSYENLYQGISSVNNIENIDCAVVTGIETHVCVYQTVKDLQKLGQKVEVVADAVTSRNLNDHDVALKRIMQEGSFLTTAEMLLFSMQKNAQGTNFKELVALVK